MNSTGIAYFCCSDRRRAMLAQQSDINGIDYIEVADLAATELSPAEKADYNALPVKQRPTMLWQRKLTVYFVNPLKAAHIQTLGLHVMPDGSTQVTNMRIQGGERQDGREIALMLLKQTASSLVLRASKRGDLSRYRLALVTSAQDPSPPAVFDPLLAALDFSFSVECPSDFDCAPQHNCPPVIDDGIEIDYLTRDFATFRRLMLDRIATLSPAWRERHVPDIGMTLVELVAYVADYLSYRQEAVATEAYLGTARKRVSVRRHVRLVDYPMHEGCNARVWVQISVDDKIVSGAGVALPLDDPTTKMRTSFLTNVGISDCELDAEAGEQILTARRPEIFELLLPAGDTSVRLYPQHNVLQFYTWGAADCCLPKGATRATLAGKLDQLRTGDVLIFAEIADPVIGGAGEPDPSHRHAVRVTDVVNKADPIGGRFLEPPTSTPIDVTEIAWAEADALPFPLCVSATISVGNKVTPTAIAEAYGNVVLADHGRRAPTELLAPVPAPTFPPFVAADRCANASPLARPVRFRPNLSQPNLTHAGPAVDRTAPAAAAMNWDMADVAPVVELTDDAGSAWNVRRDLLDSGPNAQDFVVEIESDGAAQLRFGDGTNGRPPRTATVFSASYRVGNGMRGNVGAEAIRHVISSVGGISSVRNPIAARGGVDPEPLEDVRRFAPVAFRKQERAVTETDYATMARRHPQIQDAAATFRWTGSWRTVFITPDAFASKDATKDFDPALTDQLEPYRMAGHDVTVDRPRYVPVEIAMQVCTKADYFRADVKAALLDVFSARDLPDGRRGVFHPDNFAFGQSLYVSVLYAAALAVDGVASVLVTTFQRQGHADLTPLAEGKLAFARLEIPRLDNDPNFPDRGVFTLDVAGGK